MLQDFIMNFRSICSIRDFAVILASDNRSLHYLEAICKFLLSEHTETHILAFYISQYLLSSEWNLTNW